MVDPSWKLLPGTERGILMGKLADLIEANKEILAAVDSWDNGMHDTRLQCARLKQHLLTDSQANRTLWP